MALARADAGPLTRGCLWPQAVHAADVAPRRQAAGGRVGAEGVMGQGAAVASYAARRNLTVNVVRVADPTSS